MRRALLVCAAALCLAATAGCGEDTERAPKGSPEQRHGAEAIETVVAGEQIRAQLVAASDLYGLRRHDEARAHLREAQRGYAALSGAVAERDARLDQEIRAGFDRVDLLMARRASFDEMRDLAGPLSDQLIGGALVELVDDDARGDRGLEAEVARRLAHEMSRAYSDGSLDDSYGLLARTQSIARGLSKSLGPQKGAVTNTLSSIREKNFPEGIGGATPQPAAEVQEQAQKVSEALTRRYRLES